MLTDLMLISLAGADPNRSDGRTRATRRLDVQGRGREMDVNGLKRGDKIVISEERTGWNGHAPL